MITNCSYIKCKTGLPGVIIPIAGFKAINAPAYLPEGHAILSDLRLCESCALTAKIHEIINDKRWAEICYQIKAAGGAPPDRETLRLILGSPKDKPIPKIMRQAIEKMRRDGH